MRTGIKHLLGLFATLLLLLTLIAWAHRFYRASTIDITAGPFFISFMNLERSLGLYASYGFDKPHGLHGSYEWSINGPGLDGSYAVLESNRWKGFGFEFGRDERPDDQAYVQILCPPWFMVLALGVPTALYVRFLIRRRRTPEPEPADRV